MRRASCNSCWIVCAIKKNAPDQPNGTLYARSALQHFRLCHPEARVFCGPKDLCTPLASALVPRCTDPSTRQKNAGLRMTNYRSGKLLRDAMLFVLRPQNAVHRIGDAATGLVVVANLHFPKQADRKKV